MISTTSGSPSLGDGAGEFSFRTRERALERFQKEEFDLLIVGGGITGAATARDAVSRGLRVALIERKDYAFGTSSRSSKLIHGGLRYLQKFELKLVFEALAERSFFLKVMPHRVKSLSFYYPIYREGLVRPTLLSFGLWLYDILALFRSPEFHSRYSSKKLLAEIPFLKEEGLLTGFKFYDATMMDDVLAVETIRAAHEKGAATANYIEAVEPLWNGDRIVGFKAKDQVAGKNYEIRASQTVVCAGPWTDKVGVKLSNNWKQWLNPSKGVHLVFDHKRIPVPGTVVMSHPKDGRISFVVPRTDFGTGVVIVGTTDSPTPDDPDRAEVVADDVHYLMNLLNLSFPKLRLTAQDIVSAYVGVRPLVDDQSGEKVGVSLQKVSREHQIEEGPGGTVIVAGGKYTTHRKMAEEVVDFALKTWKKEFKKTGKYPLPQNIGTSHTKLPLSANLTQEETEKAVQSAQENKIQLPQELLERYGADALRICQMQSKDQTRPDPAAFPMLQSQLRYAIQKEMVIHLEDFYLRRVPLFLSRSDGGLPWAEALARVWAAERGLDEKEAASELERLKAELENRSAWKKTLKS